MHVAYPAIWLFITRSIKNEKTVNRVRSSPATMLALYALSSRLVKRSVPLYSSYSVRIRTQPILLYYKSISMRSTSFGRRRSNRPISFSPQRLGHDPSELPSKIPLEIPSNNPPEIPSPAQEYQPASVPLEELQLPTWPEFDPIPPEMPSSDPPPLSPGPNPGPDLPDLPIPPRPGPDIPLPPPDTVPGPGIDVPVPPPDTFPPQKPDIWPQTPPEALPPHSWPTTGSYWALDM